jgi:CRISPR-associated endonuclease/helicase Cas3
MNDSEFLAHSSKYGIPEQTYKMHISNVMNTAVRHATNAAKYYNGDRIAFIDSIKASALYHDLGKLDNANQEVLRRVSLNPLPIAHEDAGVVMLDKLGHKEAAVLVYGHHEGLFSTKDELAKQGRPFRQLRRTTPEGVVVADHVDRNLHLYEVLHQSSGCSVLQESKTTATLHHCGFSRRIALSCLIDADHGDTARHYGHEVETKKVKPRWKERLMALERYVYGLPVGKSDREQTRNRLRRRMFDACHDAPTFPSIRACDAPVGSGKTTAIMANLLRVAINRKLQLRHIIVVLPYTNIINQSVEVYRKALVLEGERPEEIVAEHHHRTDFSAIDLRQLATLWEAPIIVTTAVQFFETLGSANPARLRKLHELPGSAVFIDEMHAAIPSHLWPQMWRWLETWTRQWCGYLVLASGSLARFWELDEYRSIMNTDSNNSVTNIPDLITDLKLKDELKTAEERRITYCRRPDDANALDLKGIIDFVTDKKPGPNLLIVNTVQTAALISQAMRSAGYNVLHLSTALAPVHRDIVIERVKQRLRDRIEHWTLVATSCVEAGLDFSFRTGFRERSSTSSLIQIGGRINRGDESIDAEVWDILLRDDQFRDNPALTISRRALDSSTIDDLNTMSPDQLATIAMRREWTSGSEEKAKKLIELEDSMEYPSVSNECHVIAADTRTVLIDRSLAEPIRRGEKVSKIEVMKYSVQIWAHKIAKLALEPLIQEGQTDSGMYLWQYDYDPDFLGYMKGVLKLEDFMAAGGAII